MIKKMQETKACFANTDKNEYGPSLQRSSTHRPSNQTYGRNVNVFEGDTFEVARVNNNNNVRRNTKSEKSELNDVDITEYRQQYESNSKPMWMSSSKCESIDSLEVNTGWRDCDYKDRRKRVKNMHEIYKKCALWIIHMDME